MLGTSLPASEAQSPTPEDLQDILAHCAGIEDEHEHNTVKEVSERYVLFWFSFLSALARACG